jgi:aquaporin Z
VVRSPFRRRVIIGILMGLTAIALIYAPFGQRSGAHMNPGFTLAFLALGKIAPWDAMFYIAAQFAGGVCGVRLAATILRHCIRHPTVNYAVTQPRRSGLGIAWTAEFVMAFALMAMVLIASNHNAIAPYTGILAGILIALFITVEAPISGMSMNPARTLASALPARSFRGLWIYFTAPPLAMLAAAGLYAAASQPVFCAKLNHNGRARCIFHCRIYDLKHGNPSVAACIQDPPGHAAGR